jgi:hypothetical protein
MSSTSILSRPTGPREDFTTFAIDCVAKTALGNVVLDDTILVSDVLVGYLTTTEEEVSTASSLLAKDLGHLRMKEDGRTRT